MHALLIGSWDLLHFTKSDSIRKETFTMLYLHYLHYVSQRLAEEAMQQIAGLSYIKSLQVLDMPSSWLSPSQHAHLEYATT